MNCVLHLKFGVFCFSLCGLLLQLSTKLRELRERETLTNSLHRHLQTLSHTLSAACKLVGDRDDVIEVRGHIQQCKVCMYIHSIGIWDGNWVAPLTDALSRLSRKCTSSCRTSQTGLTSWWTRWRNTSPPALSLTPAKTCSTKSNRFLILLHEKYFYTRQSNFFTAVWKCFQIKEDWEKVCGELAVVPQLEPTLRVNMLRNVATVIKTMESDLPGLEVTSLKLDDVIAKQKKARVSQKWCMYMNIVS